MDVINFSGMLLFADGKELTQQQFEYLALFCDVPRFKRDVALLKDHPDPLREAVGLPLGAEGEFFVSSHEYQQLPDDSEKKASAMAKACSFD